MRGRLFFRQLGDHAYISYPMSRAGDKFEGRIPSRYVTGPCLEYYIVLYLADGTAITSPERDPVELPHVIVIIPAEQGWLEVLYPEPNTVIETKMPQISAAFDPSAVTTEKDIQVKLDGGDVTGDCEITRDFFLYVPSEELRPGSHVVTVINSGKSGTVSSWQFSVAGETGLLQSLSGGLSLMWQWAGTNSDSPFLLYSPGFNPGLSAQVAGQTLGQEFDAWINRSTFYRFESTDFGLNSFSDKFRVSAGDMFPSTSRLTLDGMPARGGEVEIKPFRRVALYLVGAESRLFTDSEDEFISPIFYSRFGGFQLATQPLKDEWEISGLYIHAQGDAELEPELSVEKRNDIFSLRTKLMTPIGVALQGEWAVSRHLTNYGEGFALEQYKDNGLSLSLTKNIKSLTLELFYLNVGERFFSEVNPFMENGRRGFGLSGRYYHRMGLSAQGEFYRYRQSSETNTEVMTNASLSPPGLPSISAVYYQQRVPYAKYDTIGMSIGSSYRIKNLDISVNWSRSSARLWTDDTERRSISISTSLRYKVAKGTDLGIDYLQFGGYKEGKTLRRQMQASTGISHKVGRNHLLAVDLKLVRFTDKENIENSYVEKVLISKYGYSF